MRNLDQHTLFLMLHALRKQTAHDVAPPEYHSRLVVDASEFSDKFLKRNGPPATFMLARIAKLNEELSELATASAAKNVVELADALIDIAYVALATATAYDFPVEELWRTVHTSNMTRTRMPNFRASKGPDFVPNEVVSIMENWCDERNIKSNNGTEA